MRRLFAWTAGLVGIAALARMLARRQAEREATAPTPPHEATSADPAEALRQKLSDTRGDDEAEPVAAQEAETTGEPTESLDDRRARVHAKAQEAIDAMQEPPG